MDEFFTLLFRFSFGLLWHSVTLYLMTNPKRGRGFTLGVWLGTFVFTSLVAVPFILFVPDVNILFVVEAFTSLAIYCAVYLWASKGPVWRNLFLFFAYASFFLFSLTLASCLSQMFFQGSHWATIGGRTLFQGLYVLWLVRRSSAGAFPPSEHLEQGWLPLAAFSVFSGLTLYITALTFLILQVEPGIRLAISAVLFLLIGSAYLVAGRTVALMLQEHETQQAEAQRKLLENQLSAEREFVNQANTHRHDLHHHISLLNDYLQRKDLEGARAYLSQYQAELDSHTLEVYCKNTVANALLRRTARRCAAGGVPFTCRTVIPQTLSLTSPELATVLGNVLENAWEASRLCESPWISVTARIQKSILLVEIKNAVAGESRFQGDLPVSTKPGGGLGLKSVNRALEKHGGVLRCLRTGDTFFTQVVIPL